MDHDPQARTARRLLQADCRPLLVILGAAALLAGCSGEPPDAMPGPLEPRMARAEDTTAVRLPAPPSGGYCEAAQQILASTTLTGEVTVFADMPEYRHSKPSANPHRIYQVVTYAGDLPVAVSCKVKSAAHLRAVYGPEAAGAQQRCVELTRRAQAQAVAELSAAGLPEAAGRAAAYVAADQDPYLTGRDYLQDFELSSLEADGTVRLNSPGLFQNYDSWITRFLPWQVQGQHYCHLPTADYIKALATGAMPPGTIITTADDAPVTPSGQAAPPAG